jgi:cytochrome c oxidase accessory protein FixG
MGDQANRAAHGASLYESATKIYPREMRGRFANLSRLATVTLLGLFYGLPWLSWDGRQAVLFDLPARKFHLLGLTLWPQDFPYLALLLIIAALSLFFFTALAGRIWCGFACPQTVWTEAFIWMEQLTEGTRSQRMKLDQAPWSWDKLRRKGSKQFLWITFSLWTGFSFVGYFVPIRELGVAIAQADISGWTLFWGLFYSFATYGNAGYMREQVCKYMCPYARFQSAMFDKDTLIISYDPKRGEPRGGRKRSSDHRAAGLGDCIDCTLCVQVCPTGIDIRDGRAKRYACCVPGCSFMRRCSRF